MATVVAGRVITTREFGSGDGTCANPDGGNRTSPRGAKRVEADIFDRVSYVDEKADDIQDWAKTEYTYDDQHQIVSAFDDKGFDSNYTYSEERSQGRRDQVQWLRIC